MRAEGIELLALHHAAANEEGRLVIFEPMMEPTKLHNGTSSISTGDDCIRRLIGKGFMKRDGRSSLLLTERGKREVGIS